jgi:hypothetical protein
LALSGYGCTVFGSGPMLAMTNVPPGVVGPAGFAASGLPAAGLEASVGFAAVGATSGFGGALVGAAGCCPEQAVRPRDAPAMRSSKRRRPIVGLIPSSTSD